ncbi:MAG: D-alanine--D-alanine ligase family protein [bacterium]
MGEDEVPLSIAIVYTDPVELGKRRSVLGDEMGAMGEVDAVEEALARLGHTVTRVGVAGRDDRFVERAKEIRPELIFNLCESTWDDLLLEVRIPTIYETLGIPYTGSDPSTLESTIDKVKTKAILRNRGLSTPAHRVYPPGASVEPFREFPAIVKPAYGWGSFGIDRDSVVWDGSQLRRRVEYIFENLGQPAIVEAYIDGREFNVAILGNSPPEVLPISEIDFSDLPEGFPRVCTYAAKWYEDSPEYRGTPPVCPTHLSEDEKNRIERTALAAYLSVGCRDYARVDIRLGEDGIPYVLEVNANPDISPDAGFTRSILKSGRCYEDFIAKVVAFALNRKKHEDQSSSQQRPRGNRENPLRLRGLQRGGDSVRFGAHRHLSHTTSAG